jgi:hypothetical protein
LFDCIPRHQWLIAATVLDGCLGGLPLTLFVLGVLLADNAHHPFALDDLAVVADLLDRGSDFHGLVYRVE